MASPSRRQSAGSRSDVPESPSDGTTTTEVLANYVRAGFEHDFAHDHGGLRCSACGETSSPGSVTTVSLRRMEGASDPDDMVAIAALCCPRCGAGGTIVLGYGPMASEEDQDVLRSLRMSLGSADVPPHAPPTPEAQRGRSAKA